MNIEIANRLQKLRKENGYSQEELADKLGISRQAVSKWERAESSPDTDNLIILARLYNMSLDELLYDTESDEEIRKRNIDKEETRKEDNDEDISLTDDEGQSIKIKDGHVKFINKDGTEEKIKPSRIVLTVIDGVIFISTLLAFVIWGAIFNGWYVSWVLWIFMPALMSLFEAIVKKQFTKFLYPVLIAGIYCFLGMQFELWHPFWFLFLTIPAFYIIFEPIDKYVLKTKTKDDDKNDD